MDFSINPNQGGTRIMVSRSTDHGASWSSPVQVDNGQDGFVWPATVTVANDGLVYVAFHSQTGFTAPTTVARALPTASAARPSWFGTTIT